MPSESSKQHRFMEAVKHDPKFASKVGVSQKVGSDFVAADQREHKFSKGGQVGFRVHSEEKDHFLCEGNKGKFKVAKKGLHPKRHEYLRSLCHGGEVKKFADGGSVDPVAEGVDTSAAEERDPAVAGPTPATGGYLPQIAGELTGYNDLAQTVNAVKQGRADMLPGRDRFGRPMPSAVVGAAMNFAPGMEGAAGAVEKAAAKVAGKSRKVVGTIPWEKMSLQEATDAARSGAHLVQDKTGQFIGAPRGIDTPEKLQAMRDAVDEAVRTGSFGADWYERAKGAINTITGGDPVKNEQFAKLLAIYSPQSTQRSNLGFAMKSWNEHALNGREGVIANPARKNSEASAAAAMFEDPSSRAGLGPKTGAYAQKLDPATANEAAVRAVNDLWMGRTYGYAPNKLKQAPGAAKGVQSMQFDRGFTAQEHSFLTGENLLAAQRAKEQGVFPQGTPSGVPAVQASAWVSERLKQAKLQHPEWPLEKQMAWANESPQDAIFGNQSLGTGSDYLGHEPTEATPGAPGHMEGMAQQPFDLRQDFQNRSTYLVRDENGNPQDAFHRASGMLQAPAEQGVGEWVNPATGAVETNPRTTLRPGVSYETGATPSTGHPQLDSATHSLVGQANAWRSALDAQAQGFYGFGEPDASGALQGSLRSLPWTKKEGTGRVTKTLMEGGTGPAPAPGAPRSEFEPTSPRLMAKWDADPDLRQMIGRKNATDQAAVAASNGQVGPPRQDLMRLRDIIANKGWRGLAEHVAKYGYAGLPVAAVASLEALRSGQDVQQQPQFAQGGLVGHRTVTPVPQRKLLAEDELTYTIQDPDGKTFKLAKRGLSPETHAQLQQHFARGGMVRGYDVGGRVTDDLPPDLGNGSVGGGGLPLLPPPDTSQMDGWVDPGVQQQAGLPPTPATSPQGAPPMPESGGVPTEGTPAPAQQAPGPYTPPGAMAIPASQEQPDQQQQPAPVPHAADGTPGYDFSGMVNPGDLRELDDMVKKNDFAAHEQARLTGVEADLNQASTNEYLQRSAQIRSQYENAWNQNRARSQQLFDNVLSAKINPNQFWESRSTGQKLSIALGMLIGGLGPVAGAANPAMQLLQSAIERDLDAQKMNLQNKQHLLSYQLQQGHELQTAWQLAKADALDTVSAQIKLNAAKVAGPQAQAQADALSQQFRMQAFQQRQQVFNMGMERALKAAETATTVNRQRIMLYQMQVGQRAASGQPISPREVMFLTPEQQKQLVPDGSGNYRMTISAPDAEAARNMNAKLHETVQLLSQQPQLSFAQKATAIPGSDTYNQLAAMKTKRERVIANAMEVLGEKDRKRVEPLVPDFTKLFDPAERAKGDALVQMLMQRAQSMRLNTTLGGR